LSIAATIRRSRRSASISDALLPSVLRAVGFEPALKRERLEIAKPRAIGDSRFAAAGVSHAGVWRDCRTRRSPGAPETPSASDECRFVNVPEPLSICAGVER